MLVLVAAGSKPAYKFLVILFFTFFAFVYGLSTVDYGLSYFYIYGEVAELVEGDGLENRYPGFPGSRVRIPPSPPKTELAKVLAPTSQRS